MSVFFTFGIFYIVKILIFTLAITFFLWNLIQERIAIWFSILIPLSWINVIPLFFTFCMSNIYCVNDGNMLVDIRSEKLKGKASLVND